MRDLLARVESEMKPWSPPQKYTVLLVMTTGQPAVHSLGVYIRSTRHGALG